MKHQTVRAVFPTAAALIWVALVLVPTGVTIAWLAVALALDLLLGAGP